MPVFSDSTCAPWFGVPLVVRGITRTDRRLPTLPAVTVQLSVVLQAAQPFGVSPVAGYSHHWYVVPPKGSFCAS